MFNYIEMIPQSGVQAYENRDAVTRRVQTAAGNANRGCRESSDYSLGTISIFLLLDNCSKTKGLPDMQQTPDMMANGMMHGPMMWGMGIGWILILILAVLGIAALVKYLITKQKP
ncbi:MAG: hypothetical protein H6924_07980 [Alphaproteobacteria bacterium]|nr:hypothetical protein [Alphaproteobacteria bacterium]